MNAKTLATELFQKYIDLASTDGRSFRATILEELKAKTGCSHAAACTHYNNAKKAAPPVKGLGREVFNSAIKKSNKKSDKEEIIPDNECFSVLELRNGAVGRCQSFIYQGDASEKFDEKVEAWPTSEWVMIQGLGPNSGDIFKLEPDEKEIKRYTPVQEDVTV